MYKPLKKRSMSKYSGPLSKMIDKEVALKMSALKAREVTDEKGVRTITDTQKIIESVTTPGETTRGKGPGYTEAWDKLPDEQKAKFGDKESFIEEAEAWHSENTTPDSTIEVEGEVKQEKKMAKVHMPEKVSMAKATGVANDFGVIDPSTGGIVPYSSLDSSNVNKDGLIVNAEGKPYDGQPKEPYGQNKGGGFSKRPGSKGYHFSGDYSSRDDMTKSYNYTSPSLDSMTSMPTDITESGEANRVFMTADQFFESNPESVSSFGGEKNLRAPNIQDAYRKLTAADSRQGQTGGSGRESKHMVEMGEMGDLGLSQTGNLNVSEGFQGYKPFDPKREEIGEQPAMQFKAQSHMLKGRSMSFRNKK